MRAFLILLIFCFGMQVYGDYKPFSIKGGVNYSTLNYAGYDTKSMTAETSYKLGGAFYLSWEKRGILFGLKNSYLNIDFGVNQKGTYVSQNYHFLDTSEKKTGFSLISLELPIMLGYRFLDALKVYFGCYVSQGLYDTRREHFVLLGDNDSHIMVDFGFLIGLEYEVHDFLINFRFQQGLRRLYPADKGNGFTDYYENSRQFVLMVGYRLF